MTTITRRNFMEGMTLAGAGALAATSLASAGESAAQEWAYETDVLVVGYGGAGAATAISAIDAGAEVLIIEKAPVGGGNTCASFGGFLNVNDVEQSITYINNVSAMSRSYMDADWVRTFSEMSTDAVDWMKSISPDAEIIIYGGAGYPNVEGSSSQEKCMITSDKLTPGVALFDALSQAAEERGAQVLYNTEATELVQADNGQIIGVVATQDGAPVCIKARRAVVLACGGYETGDYYLQNYLKGFPVVTMGTPYNTGDGIKMAQRVGADLWHMNGEGSCAWGMRGPTASAPIPQMGADSYIWVDQNGRRFHNERNLESHAALLLTDFFSTDELKYPRLPMYHVFDDAVRSAGRVISRGMGWALVQEDIQWSEDNLAEVDAGYILKGETIEELAEQIGCDPAVLAATVEKWNADVEAGEDTEFGRDLATCKPLATPPFYAIETYPAFFNTQGGPRRDTSCRVIDVDGNPIPRLYSAGELGSFWGVIYQGAGANGESIVTGRIAGPAAAAEEPWE